MKGGASKTCHPSLVSEWMETPLFRLSPQHWWCLVSKRNVWDFTKQNFSQLASFIHIHMQFCKIKREKKPFHFWDIFSSGFFSRQMILSFASPQRVNISTIVFLLQSLTHSKLGIVERTGRSSQLYSPPRKSQLLLPQQSRGIWNREKCVPIHQRHAACSKDLCISFLLSCSLNDNGNDERIYDCSLWKYHLSQYTYREKLRTLGWAVIKWGL